MKYFLPCLIISASLFAQKRSFTINATVKGAQDGAYLYLQHKYNDILYTDSAQAKTEKLSFKGKVKEPNMYWFTTRKNANAALVFFVDGGKVDINAHIDSLPNGRVKAGITQDDYLAAQKVANEFNSIRSGLVRRHGAYSARGDMQGMQRIIDSAQAEEAVYAKNMENFIKKHPNSNASAYMIYAAQFDWPSIAAYDAMYNALGSKVKIGKFGKLAQGKINSMKGTTVGYPALDFAQPDVTGKMVSLSSYKGKYVLVDFWASWCGPCRKENPHVVEAYQKFKDKGFDILGVSLDDNKGKWLAAIEKDKLTWTHVSDLKGWQNAAGKLYGVQSIPFNLLLDKEGKIVAKGLRGHDLEAKLAELLGP